MQHILRVCYNCSICFRKELRIIKTIFMCVCVSYALNLTVRHIFLTAKVLVTCSTLGTWIDTFAVEISFSLSTLFFLWHSSFCQNFTFIYHYHEFYDMLHQPGRFLILDPQLELHLKLKSQYKFNFIRRHSFKIKMFPA